MTNDYTTGVRSLMPSDDAKPATSEQLTVLRLMSRDSDLSPMERAAITAALATIGTLIAAPAGQRMWRVRFREAGGQKRRCSSWFTTNADGWVAELLQEATRGRVKRIERIDEVDPATGKTIHASKRSQSNDE